MKLRPVMWVFGPVMMLLVGCGSTTSSAFNDNGAGDGDAGGDGRNGGGGGLGGGGGGLGGGDAGSGAGGGLGDLSACATSSANGQLEAVNLVFMYDKTGSMKDAVGSSTKWAACKAGVQAFFSDSASAGMSAELTFFSGNKSAQCNGNDFRTPSLALTPLPNGSAFTTVIAGVSPGGDTPTLGAETAAVSQAKALLSSHAGEKAVIVMVTDGDPKGCSDGGDITPAASAAEAAFKATPSIPTYVIGVGESLPNLNTLAAKGGTTQAFVVDTTDPQQSTQQMVDALNKIRGAVASGCDFTLPAPPTGQTLDIDKVNVNYTPGSGSPQTLTYDPNCTNGSGWHYDALPSPHTIMLCPGTCTDVKGSAGGKVTIAFGCSTQGGVR